MQFNCKMGYSGNEQDYQLIKTSLSELKKVNNQKDVLRYLTNVLPNPTDIVTLDNAQNTVKSVKAQLANVNLLDPSLYNTTTTFQGITYTTNGDTITLTGTAAASSYVNIFSSNADAVIPLPSILQNKKIKLYAYGNSYTVELLVRKTTGVNAVIANTNQSLDTTGAVGFSIRCRFTSGNTYNDSIKFMIIEEGAENNPAYTPYISDFSTVKVSSYVKNLLNLQGRTDAQPTGNWPISKYDVGHVIYRGFAYSGYYQLLEEYKCDVNVDGSTITVIQKVNNYGVGYLVKCRPNTQYIFSATTDLNGFFVRFIDKDGNKIDTENWSKIFTTTSDTEYIIICLYNTTAGTFTIKNPQLELGSTATEYEPYQGQTYTPTATGEVTGITVLTPTTNIINDKGLLFTKVTGDDFNYIN